MGMLTLGGIATAETVAKQNWGDFKLWIDPGHSKTENQGLYNYSEAQKVLRVGLATRQFLFDYTTADTTTIKMTRDDDQDDVSLEERSDMANAWGADFFYAIHSDAGSNENQTLFLFGGWYENGTAVEKTPNGGKRFSEILDPNLTGVMYNTTSRGSWYDRYYYDRVTDHDYHFPYLSVNRRTNCASMLSEGGFHTLPMQQALNLNDSYKRLEAFGTARAIMEYRGITRPDKVLLAGVVTNSETGEPINGATVKVNGDSIVTDSYDSLFKNYTKNPDLIHNGFFLFENLQAGKSYDISYSCPGFSSSTASVTMKSDPQGLSGNNVTWANVALTSNAPAVVSSIDVADAGAVHRTVPITITFSRKMNRESVEKAFAISNNGQCTFTWKNDYTLVIDISKLADEETYTITIDGSIAKNSQTNQYLDGNADGTEGGNYTFTFTTVPADTQAPYVVSTTPAKDSTMLYTLRPAIRIEYNEELAWNEDDATDAIVLADKDGNKIEGTITHAVVNGASVLHLYPSKDLTLDKAYKVTVKGGFKDLAGNLSEGYTFKFLSEYHPVEAQKVLDECTIDHWWAPDGSGSTAGTTSKTGVEESTANYIEQANVHSGDSVKNTIHLHYKFDDSFAGPWQIREYRSYQQNYYDTSVKGYVLQCCVYGDGSNNKVAHMVRVRANGGSIDGIKRNLSKTLNYRGWDIMAWDINKCGANNQTFTGSDPYTFSENDTWCYDSFWLNHEMTADQGDMYKDNDGVDDSGNPITWQDWSGDIYIDDYKYVKYGEATQTAKLSDITDEPETGVSEVASQSSISINAKGSMINVVAGEKLQTVTVYSVNGATVLSTTPRGNVETVDASQLAPGVYVVKAITAGKQNTKRVIIK